MKLKCILPILILGCFTFSGYGQNAPDTITIIKKGKFHKNEEFLNVNQLLELMRNNPEAFMEMKRARSNSTLTSILGFAGGFMIGWPIGQSIGSGEANWGMAGIGAGLIVVSIPLYNSYKNHSTRAVNIYNEGLMRQSKVNYQLNLCFTGKNMGLVLRF